VTARPALGLLSRLRPTPISVADLREAAADVLPGLATAGLQVSLQDRPGAGTVVVLREDERSLRVDLADLAEDLTRARVAATPAGLEAALTGWVARRPVTDAAAAARGVAVLDWTDACCGAVGWRVVVPREDDALPWTPSRGASTATVARAREAALDRAAALTVDLRVEGPLALWSHATPVLASAVLAEPERALAHAARAGLSLADAHVVVTPSRPVAVGDGRATARLAGATGEPCVRLPWRAVATLPWI
jgi:hypothetical protein